MDIKLSEIDQDEQVGADGNCSCGQERLFLWLAFRDLTLMLVSAVHPLGVEPVHYTRLFVSLNDGRKAGFVDAKSCIASLSIVLIGAFDVPPELRFDFFHF